MKKVLLTILMLVVVTTVFARGPHRGRGNDRHEYYSKDIRNAAGITGIAINALTALTALAPRPTQVVVTQPPVYTATPVYTQEAYAPVVVSTLVVMPQPSMIVPRYYRRPAVVIAPRPVYYLPPPRPRW